MSAPCASPCHAQTAWASCVPSPGAGAGERGTRRPAALHASAVGAAVQRALGPRDRHAPLVPAPFPRGAPASIARQRRPKAGSESATAPNTPGFQAMPGCATRASMSFAVVGRVLADKVGPAMKQTVKVKIGPAPATPSPRNWRPRPSPTMSPSGAVQSRSRKNSRISCASVCGCSSAAKCPPLGITVQRRMSNTRSAAARGGRRISRGNSQ